ncbi:MAG: amphi-Trp domain-containing protein [Proteobacteria bacterium]|nr:amphi-Trp domain-containing protein [Pseudomonadota bacterium]
MSKHEIDFKSVMELEQVAAYLGDLAASLKQGVVCIQKGSDFVVLNAPGLVKVEMEAKEKKDKCKFSLELSWKGEMEAKADSSDLKISSVVPEPVQETPEESKDESEPTEENQDNDGPGDM